jgi:hypothetical protein
LIRLIAWNINRTAPKDALAKREIDWITRHAKDARNNCKNYSYRLHLIAVALLGNSAAGQDATQPNRAPKLHGIADPMDAPFPISSI